MKTLPIITTIIVTYQRPQLLKKAIRSVLNQTYPHFYVIICDDASGDETSSVVTEYLQQDSRIKYHCHPKNIGMIENYKFGFSQIQTDFFSILSDDDVLLPEFFAAALDSFEKNPKACLFAGSTIIMTSKGKVIRVPLSFWKKEGVFNPPDGMLEMISKYPIPNGVLFRKEVIKQISIDEENPLTWDCDYLLHCASRFPIIVSKTPCALFLQHNQSYSFSQNDLRWESTFYRLINRIEHCFQLPSVTVKEAKNRIFFDLYNWYLQRHRYDKAASIAEQLNSYIDHDLKTKLNLKIAGLPSFLISLLNPIRKLKHKILVDRNLQKQYGVYFKYIK